MADSILNTLDIMNSKGILMKLNNDRKLTNEETMLLLDTISALENELRDTKQELIKMERKLLSM